MTNYIYMLASSIINLQSQPLEIANKVAGDGAPHCITFDLLGNSSNCKPIFYISKSRRIDAKSVGIEIFFTFGSISKLTNDEFALLAGHEIAHYYLGHTRSSRTNELEADKLGAQLACNAGFDPIAGISIFRFAHRTSTHPSAAERVRAVQRVHCPSRGHIALRGQPHSKLEPEAQPAVEGKRFS